MTDKETPAPEAARCGDKAPHFRLSCDRPEGHVRSASPDDWHEASATITERQEAQDWTCTATRTENGRWAPRPWDIPRTATHAPKAAL